MKRLNLRLAILILPAAALPAAARAADLCANVKAGVTITDLSYADGMVKASGTWEVGAESPGAMLEYRLQSDRQRAESRSGTSGAWEVSLPWKQCDRSTFRVDVFPSLKVGDVLLHCTENGKWAKRSFTVSCAPSAELGPCQWECSGELPARCTGTCTGSGKGGIGALVALQGINHEGFQIVEGPSGGPWTWTVTCKTGDKVSFRVMDQTGAGALAADRPCGQ